MNDQGSTISRGSCHIEYHGPCGVQVLSRDPKRFLAIVAELEAAGTEGEVVLVVEPSNRVIIRHTLTPSPAPTGP